MCKPIMGICIALALISPFNTAIAASKSPKLAKCDGKQRRPANPYGSILPTVDPANGTAIPADQRPERRGVEVFQETPPAPPKPQGPEGKPAPQVPPISSASLAASYRSC